MKKTSLGELIANAVSHGVGVLFAITYLILLLVKSNSITEALVSTAFGVSMIVLYLSSTLFHSFPENMKRVYRVFQRFDHSSIFLLITGTYTPFIVLCADTLTGHILLGSLWLITITGIVFKSIWIDKFHYVHLALYVLMGWSVVLVWSDIQPNLGNSLWFLLIGGISYTLGVGFYVSRFKYAHFVWHIFVLLGSFMHFLAVWGIL
ncbi:PAQR family membrane homeostasis protein TrhA [Candidatus Xianfuyuplasma coldseepsis]|uniref:Hemolysin III family protein n=1 Tax=Candidatus Xianfuyuplasma coldseepsis TaxID=2782163 RepID=A0A7L7KPS7_9MOLU|nr:hemolysin III family protein [Xianfuyuplasma coldseepsis]QMS84790.1 hemolysin III family protein [Xianfuyuplasma coldseepsis]